MGFVYQIRNIANNKIYIGSTKKSPNIRKNRHFYDLDRKKHHCIYLQRSYNKYGKEFFVFEILESNIENYKNREQNLLDTLDNLFNLSKKASGGDLISYHPEKDKIIAKIAKTVREKISKMSKKERQNKWGKLENENPNWKGGLIKQKSTCELCGGIKSLSSKTCIRCQDRTGHQNPFYGKKHTKQTKIKISKKNKNKPNYKDRKKVYAEGVIYDSCTIAAKYYNMTIPAMAYRIKSKNYKNFYYIYSK
jgi:group I intron endonuclease